MYTIQNQTQKYTIEKSIKDTDTENLNKKRKHLRQKNKQNTKRQGRICRTRQSSEKETQNKSTEEKKELILETQEARKGPRQTNKHRNKQMMMSMRKESG